MADQFDREDVEAVAACLGDDAAQLREENDQDERADNMDRAASMLTWMLLTHPIFAPGVMAAPAPAGEPPEDSFPDQTILHAEGECGNCLQATIAGVLGWPLAAVPHFALLGEDHWWDCAQAWLSSQGYWIDYKATSYADQGGELLPRCWLSGRSPRGFSHAVIGDSATGQMLHDPHPSRAGLVEVGYTIYFFRKPARGVPAVQQPEQTKQDAAFQAGALFAWNCLDSVAQQVADPQAQNNVRELLFRAWHHNVLPAVKAAAGVAEAPAPDLAPVFESFMTAAQEIIDHNARELVSEWLIRAWHHRVLPKLRTSGVPASDGGQKA